MSRQWSSGSGQDFVDDFEWFIDQYDAVRHFGVVTDGSRHRDIATLTVEETQRCFRIGRRVWREVLAVHGRKFGAKLADLDLDNLDHLQHTWYEESDPGPLAGSVEKEEQGEG